LAFPARILRAEDSPDALDNTRRRSFIDADSNSGRQLAVRGETPEIDSPQQGALDDRVLPIADIDRNRIEVMRRQHSPTAVLQAARQRRRRVRDTRGDLP